MKALSLDQPWASLPFTPQPCDLGCSHWTNVGGVPTHRSPMVKRFETRPWPCPPNLIGQPLAIHATVRKPSDEHVGEYQAIWSPEGAYKLRHLPTARTQGDAGALVDVLFPDTSEGRVTPLPLGAVVGSCRVTASLPIVDSSRSSPVEDHVDRNEGRLLLSRNRHLDCIDISNQLPYGDWSTDGKPRYAWEIVDAAPTTERCPWCWNLDCDEPACSVCKGAGRCDPVPARGRQRIWNWQP